MIILPGGFWLDGMHHREAELRPLTGADEQCLLEIGESFFPAQQTTAVLARCLSRLGPLKPVTAEAVRSLTVGDREALLLHLRRLTLGDRLQCVLCCPRPDCKEKLDLDLKVGDFLLPPYAHNQALYERSVAENGNRYGIRFRLPTGADQEVAASLAYRDPEAAADMVLRRCIECVTADGIDGKPIEDWPPTLARQLAADMAALDPQAELMLNLTCPACGSTFISLFDTAMYFFQEIASRMKHLYREVHLLAFYYHWSEAEIMGMTARKRHRYLKLLAEALTEEGRR
jgi:hypothetical protein